ncbi:MAG: Glutamyl-tRNA(Gln) amidotransferase subunit C [Candidatus Marinimicrobia bacterium]|nr:Glutamyl-tRNA(Gln) amidotransferase subunit C [Candidatus Neomarinimicrobiota bacterium]
MSITVEQVEHVARLAKLQLSTEEKEAYTRQLSDILAYVEKLDELDTENVEPLSHVMDVTNAFRKDAAGESLAREKALENAPKSDGEFFIVPKVIK